MRPAVNTLALALLLVAPLAGAESRHTGLLGSWEIDPAHSSYKGRAPLRSGNIRFERVPNGIHVVCEVITAGGIPFHFEYQGPEDGTVLKVSGNPYYDSESTTWVNDHTARRTELRAGTAIGSTTMTLAADGRSFTAVSERSAPQDGHLYTSTIVWKRTAAS